jgi:putative ABC transport system ATP-binding protein
MLCGGDMIRVENVSKAYGGASQKPVQALRSVSFEIQAGEFVAVMGSSGSGKSTLMNILGCLDRPSAGAYHLNGKSIVDQSRCDLARMRLAVLGFVFQNFQLLPRLNALQNVELPLQYVPGISGRKRREIAATTLARVGLSKELNRLPTELSGGQQQRVAIARALVNSPKVVLADEPTGNLDTRTGFEVLALLQELNRAGLTILLVTHEVNVAACASRRLVLRDGKLVGDMRQAPADATAELLKLPVEVEMV